MPRPKPLKAGPKRTLPDAVRDAELRSDRSDRLVSISDVQRLTGYDPNTIRRWIAKGLKPEPGKGPKGAVLIDMRVLLDWRESQAAEEARRSVAGSHDEEDAEADLDAEIKRQQLLGQKIRNAERAGVLVLARSVLLMMGVVTNAFRISIEGLADRIERDLAGFPREVVREAKKTIREHCRVSLEAAEAQMRRDFQKLTKDRLIEVGADPDEEDEDEIEIEEGDDADRDEA